MSECILSALGTFLAIPGAIQLIMVSRRDTVSSVGVVRGKLLPLTDSCEHICFFRHALALDERRVKFLPEYARGGESVVEEHSKPQTKKDTKEQAAQPRSTVLPQSQNNPGETDTIVDMRQPHIKEVWFPGSHSDMWVHGFVLIHTAD